MNATSDSRPLSRIFGIVGIAMAVGAYACTTKTTPTEKREETPQEAEAKPSAAEPAGTKPTPSVAVTTFTGPEDKAGWFGTLAADHVTRRLHVASGNQAPPLYVFGWRQAMSAARSLDLVENKLEARAADLMVELGVSSSPFSGKSSEPMNQKMERCRRRSPTALNVHTHSAGKSCRLSLPGRKSVMRTRPN